MGLFRRMLMQLLQLSRQNAPFSLWTGVLLVLNVVSIIKHLLLFPVVTLQRFNVQFAWLLIPPLLPRRYLVLITSLTSCMLREPLFTGMLEKEWRRENFLRLVKIWLHLKRIMKKLVQIFLMMLIRN